MTTGRRSEAGLLSGELHAEEHYTSALGRDVETLELHTVAHALDFEFERTYSNFETSISSFKEPEKLSQVLQGPRSQPK